MAPRCFASQPTRGVDIGATEFIHRSILALRDQGKAVFLISSELSEVKKSGRPDHCDPRRTDCRRV